MSHLYIKIQGLESLVKNLVYFFMIVRLLNLLGEDSISGYYLAMHIIWSFALVPVLALSECSKVLVANHSSDVQRVRGLWHASILIGLLIILLWLLLLPLWKSFATFLNPNVAIVNFSVRTVTLLFIPYVILSLNMVTDSVFYGLGRTRYMAYQSIIVNGTIYVAAFLAYVMGAWVPTFDTIMYLFASGIMLDSVLTLYFLRVVLAKGPAFFFPLPARTAG